MIWCGAAFEGVLVVAYFLPFVIVWVVVVFFGNRLAVERNVSLS